MDKSHVANLNRIAKYLRVAAGKIDINNEKVNIIWIRKRFNITSSPIAMRT